MGIGLLPAKVLVVLRRKNSLLTGTNLAQVLFPPLQNGIVKFVRNSGRCGFPLPRVCHPCLQAVIYIDRIPLQ